MYFIIVEVRMYDTLHKSVHYISDLSGMVRYDTLQTVYDTSQVAHETNNGCIELIYSLQS